MAYLFLTLLFWWWWEFKLGQVESWTFELYLFVVFYAVVLFLTASVLFPDGLEGYHGYRDYFYSRRVWLFGLLGLARLTDIADSLMKGEDDGWAIGTEYHVMSVLHPALYVVAISTRNPRFHGAFAIAMLTYQASWALRQYWVVG